MPDYRYKAFVSYSWADAEWGKWLLHSIETYRTPAAMVGKPGAHGPVPERLHPLFKDREEEAAGASIGAAVETALASSEFLIVICSPRSAKSQWVNHEVAWFKTHRDPRNILALIVDGEPGSGGDSECFPRALTHRVNPDLTITDVPVDAPLAADARITGDGKHGARLKIAAAMLGVGLGELINRDDRRRALRTRIVVASSLALAAVMGGMAWYAIQARNEAVYQRSQSDGLVEFMLTDLRQRLEPVGRLDALDVVGKRALSYYAQQKPGNLDADALGRRARALHLVGEVSNIRGDSVDGLTAFRQAAATTGEQLARDPGNAQRIFDHAQSVYWVGYVAYERGELAEAEKEWREYARLADKLIALDPRKSEWRMEVSYSRTNLGVLQYDQGRYGAAQTSFSRALKELDAADAGKTISADRALERGTAVNWYGKALAADNRIEEGLRQFRQEIGIYDGVLARDPANNAAKWHKAIASQHIGQLELIAGRLSQSIAAYDASLAVMTDLRRLEPGNTEWQETMVRAMDAQIDNLVYAGKLAQARTLFGAGKALLDQMIAKDPKNVVWAIGRRASFDVRGARLALASGDAAQALNLAQQAIDLLRGQSDFNGPEAGRSLTDAGIAAGDAALRLRRPGDARRYWLAAQADLQANRIDFQSANVRARYLLAKRLGDQRAAQDAASALDRQGYKHPAYASALTGRGG